MNACSTLALPFLQANSAEVQKHLTDLNVKVSDPTDPIGVDCTTVTNGCTTHNVCCENNSFVRVSLILWFAPGPADPPVLICMPCFRTASSLLDAPPSALSERRFFLLSILNLACHRRVWYRTDVGIVVGCHGFLYRFWQG